MRRWLGLALLFPVCSFAAGVCKPVDLRPLLGAPLHQGNSGYCFAHTSSVLIRAKLGLRVSPMQLATTYLLANPEELSGPADSAVRNLLTPGFFADWKKSRLEEPGNYSPEKILTPEGLLNTGGDELQTLTAANYIGLCDESKLPTGKNVYKNYLRDIKAFHARRVVEGIPREEMELPIGEVADPEARAMAWSFRHWVSRRCGEARLPELPLVPTEISLAPNLRSFRRLQSLSLAATIATGRSRVMEAVDRELDRGNPVAIGYALSDIMPGESSQDAGLSPVPAEVDHASIFAGRRELDGKCYYYLRNSFGKEIAGYKPKLKERFENGGVWVLPEELPSLYSAVWLE